MKPRGMDVDGRKKTIEMVGVSPASPHLIAAAPEMLEALRTAKAHLNRLGDHGIDDVLDEAIARAEGKP